MILDGLYMIGKPLPLRGVHNREPVILGILFFFFSDLFPPAQ